MPHLCESTDIQGGGTVSEDVLHVLHDLQHDMSPPRNASREQLRETTHSSRHELEVHVDRVDGVLVITPVGDVDIVTGGLLLEALIAAISAGETQLVVDLDQVPFMDSTALTIFLTANRGMAAVGGRLRVVASEQRPEIFRLAWVDQICAVYSSLLDAVRAIATSDETADRTASD